MDEFRKNILKVHDSRVHKIHKSLGVYDAYKWARKKKWLDIKQSITEHDYYAIIRGVNKLLANKFLKTGFIRLPERMGDITLRKTPTKIKLVDGKIKTNLPIDWDTTLKLWAEDKESYNNKVLIRSEEKELFKVVYDRSKAKYNNKSFYDFKLNRKIKISLKEQIKYGNLDAFLCGKT